MDRGLYRGVAGMAAEARRLDAVASNLAHLGSVAYKRRAAGTSSFHVPGPARAGGAATEPAIGVRSAVDWRQGPLERTGSPLDLALDGDGFLAVETPSGEAYTRDGRLRLDSAGELLTADGFPLVWAERGGSIDPTGLPVTIDGEGAVRQGEQSIGRLRLVDFADRARLAEDGRGYWRAPAGLRERAYTATVHQGALEGSNADGLSEMVSLIEVQRSFERTSRVVSAIDRSYQRLTRS